MSHVFISYSREDSKFVQKLDHDLRQRGVTTWLDQHSMQGSEQWYQALVRGIEQAYAMLVVVTPNADHSRWVLRETLYADQVGVTRIPLLPRPHQVPLHIIEMPAVELHLDYKGGMKQLLIELKRLSQQRRVMPMGKTGSFANLTRRYLDYQLTERRAEVLEALYVNLAALPQPARMGTLDPLDNSTRQGFRRLKMEIVPGERFDEPGRDIMDAREALREMPRVVLLGEPGAGKTTTINQMAVDLSREALAPDAEDARLPVFVPLREFKGDQGQTLRQFVQEQLGVLRDHFEDLLTARSLVFLFDALNEMRRKSEDGRNLLKELRDFLNEAPNWVLSCRLRDYREDAIYRVAGVGKVRLKPLDPPRIYDLMRRHFSLANEPQKGLSLWKSINGSRTIVTLWQKFIMSGHTDLFWQWGARLPHNLRESLSDTEERLWKHLAKDRRKLMILCRSPYMARILCGVYERDGRLPRNRGVLFSQFIDHLLAAEGRSRREIGAPWVSDHIIKNALSALAFAMIERFDTVVETSFTLEQAEAAVRQAAPLSTPRQILQMAHAALLIHIDGQRVRFTHQLIQEYLAAVALGQRGPGRVLAPPAIGLIGRETTKWDEVVILLYEISDQPDAVLHAVRDKDPFLAAECLSASSRTIAQAPRQHVLDSLLDALNQGNAYTRREAARVLGRVAHPYCINGLLYALEDHEPAVRYHAAQALGEIGYTQAIPYLQALAHDETVDSWGMRVSDAVHHAIDKLRGDA